MNPTNTLEKIYAICDIIEPDEYGCLNYPGMPGPGGYRRVRIKGKLYKVHRLALERKLGCPIKPGYFALHHCDNPACVSFDHLYEGTDADNIKDRMERNPESWYYAKSPENHARLVQLSKMPRSEKQHDHILQLAKKPRTEKQLVHSRQLSKNN
jgi:hypothetical protein